MHIIEQYALNTGAKIGRPDILTKFYPLPDKYVTCHFSSGMPAKNYDKWPIILKAIALDLEAKGYVIIQLGDQKDIVIGGVKNLIRLCGKTDLGQSNFIIQNSSLHISNDTFSVHVAGAFDVPLIALYTVSHPEVCGPYWHNPERTLTLESNRGGNKPSYSPHESEKTINMIPLEDVLKGINNLLDLNIDVNVRTAFEGDQFAAGLAVNFINFILEIIPDSVFQPVFPVQQPLTLRDDLFQNDDLLLENIGRFPSLVFSERKIDDKILRHPHNFGLLYILTEKNFDLDYFKMLRRQRVKFELVYKDIDKPFIDSVKLDLCDIKAAKPLISSKKPELDLEKEYKFYSSKFLFSKGKYYASMYHWKKDIETKNPAGTNDFIFKEELKNDEYEALEQVKFSCFLERT